MAQLTQSSKPTYRVGTTFNTGVARERLLGEFGVDVNRLGHLTPDEVRAISLQTKAMLQQLKLAEVACKEWKKQMEIKAKIERLRQELIDAGLMSAEEIDQILKDAVLRTAKHQEHMKSITHATGLELQSISHQGTLDRHSFEHRFRLKLQKANALHREKLQQSTTNHQQAIQEGIQSLRETARLSDRKRQSDKAFMAYISGEPQATRPASSTQSTQERSWFSGFWRWFS